MCGSATIHSFECTQLPSQMEDQEDDLDLDVEMILQTYPIEAALQFINQMNLELTIEEYNQVKESFLRFIQAPRFLENLNADDGEIYDLVDGAGYLEIILNRVVGKTEEFFTQELTTIRECREYLRSLTSSD